MPLGRFGVRNEYGLGSKELYKEGVELEDPKLVLDGLVVSGLVGLLRQLGDLSLFASEVFHGLQEEVASTSSRSRKLVTRIQHVEASLPSLEKAILSQTSHMHFAYAPGYEWHPRVKNAKNHFISKDLPHFIMDSYEECHEPPRLQLLDRFDISGPGSCLKRYTDPTFGNKEKSQRGRKARKIKRRRSSQGNEQIPNSVTKMTSNAISSQTSREVSSLSHTNSTFGNASRLDLGNPPDALNSKEGHGILKNMDGNTVETSENNCLNDQKIILVSEFMDLNYESDVNVQLAPVGVESFHQVDNLSENGSISEAYIDQQYTDTKESPDVNNSQGGYLSELASSPELNSDRNCAETVRNSIEEEEVLSENGSCSQSNASENHPTKKFDLHEHDSVEENSSEGEYDLNEHNLVIPRFSEDENSPELITNSDIGSGPLNSELSVGDIQYMLETIEGDNALGSICDDNVVSGQSDCAKLEARIREENDDPEDTFAESENNLNVIEWRHEEDTGSETDDFVDALNTIDSDSESDFDFETDTKPTSIRNLGENASIDPVDDKISDSMENISTFVCKSSENENASTEPMADKISHSEDEVCDVSEKTTSFLSLENKQSSQQSEVTQIQEQDLPQRFSQEQSMKSASSFPDETVDALKTIDSESESDFETDMKRLVESSSTSIHNPAENASIDPVDGKINNSDMEVECYSRDYNWEDGVCDGPETLISPFSQSSPLVENDQLSQQLEVATEQEENVLPHFSQEHSMQNASTFICKSPENAPTSSMADTISDAEDDQPSQQPEVATEQEENVLPHFSQEHSMQNASTFICKSPENAPTSPMADTISDAEDDQPSQQPEVATEQEENVLPHFSQEHSMQNASTFICKSPENAPTSPMADTISDAEDDQPSQQPEVATEQEENVLPHFSQEHSMQNASTFICKSPENASTSPMADTISDAEDEQPSQQPEVATEQEENVLPHFSQESSMQNTSTFICEPPENATNSPMADTVSHSELEHECHSRLLNPVDEICDGSEKSISPHSIDPMANKTSHSEMEHEYHSRVYNSEDEICNGSENPTSSLSLVHLECLENSNLECLENKQLSQQSEVTPIQNLPQRCSQENSTESPSSFPDESLDVSQEKSESPKNDSNDPVADKTNHSMDEVCDGSEKPTPPISLVHLECLENANLECLENKQSSQQSEVTQIQEQDVPQCVSQEKTMENASYISDETQAKHVRSSFQDSPVDESACTSQLSFGSTSCNQYALWTNGSLLGLQPSKPTVSSASNSVNTDPMGCGGERNTENDQITPDIGSNHVTSLENVFPGNTNLENVCSEVTCTNLNDKVESEMNSPPPSPPLEHMKISFQPITGFETFSKLKLKYPAGIDHHEFSVKTFPSFQLVPEPSILHHETDSDNDTFCGSYPCMSDESVSYCSDSDTEQWEARDVSESNYLEFYDGLRRISSAETSCSYSHQGGSEQGDIHFHSRSLNTTDLISRPISQLPTFDPQILESIFSRVFEDDPDKLQSTLLESDTTAILQKVNAIRKVVGNDGEDDNWSNT